ncbi:hypothetical protein GIB67_011277 [Kingdonia uniflora]|uniref:Transposase-associated domain-containing protein n=1 Tax=Kingdonia uniflora TaxID=39325 RepID=A0A7J7MNL4_9MAGN|nr:hypothetical protein GIB67_011277 [Kingdonia uniflora]
MDKTWRFQPRASEAYGDGVQKILDFAISHSNEPTSTKIRCAYKDCNNFKCLSSEEVYDHLVKLSGSDTMDRINSAKKMIPVQIDIARKAKRVIENLGITNNLNPRDSVGYNIYLGIMVREVVLITFATWHDVGNKFRDRLWTMIKDWREHKGQKRKVIDIKDDLEQALANCPEDVTYDQWEVFAEQCTTSDYKQGNHIPSHPVKCKLFWLTPSNVVAIGHWHNEEPTCKVHNVPLGIGMSKVSIQISLKDDVPLARGNDHLKTIGDACGSSVA